MFTIPTWVVYGIVLPTLSALGKMPDCGEKFFFLTGKTDHALENMGFFYQQYMDLPKERIRDLRSLPLSFVSAVRNRSVVASTHPKILIYYDLITNLFDYIYIHSVDKTYHTF